MGSSGHVTRRSTALWLTVSLLVTLVLVGLAPHQAAAGGCINNPKTPSRQGLLVASNNVYESQTGDARRPGDMYKFATDLLRMTPYLPDVVLLEETRKAGVNSVLKKLNQLPCDHTQAHYLAAVPAPSNPWKHVSDKKLIGTDTAIIANDVTMDWNNTGHIVHKYKLSQSSAGDPVRWKKTAFAFMHKVSDTTTANLAMDVPVAALHFPKWREFRSNSVSCQLKGKWASQIMNKLDALSGSPTFSVWGGDSNNFKTDMSGCPKPTQLYGNARSHRYTDAVIVFNPNANPIDFLFTTGNVARGQQDNGPKLDAGEPGPHAARWGLIEASDTTPPTSPRAIQKATAYPRIVNMVGFGQSLDGGSGVQNYLLQRLAVGIDSDFQTIERFPLTEKNLYDYQDKQVIPNTLYKYRVIAVDGRGNPSKPTPVVACDTPPAGLDHCNL